MGKKAPVHLRNSKEFDTEDQGMSMTIGNADFDEREDESLLETEKKGRS